MQKSLKIFAGICTSSRSTALLEQAEDDGRPGKGTISICFVHEALVGVRQRGLDAEALLLQAGISPVLLGSEQARVSPANYGALWNLIAQTLDDEFFGMDSHPRNAEFSSARTHASINL